MDVLDTRTHQSYHTLEPPYHELHLADARLEILPTGAKVDCGPVVIVIAPEDHLARHRLDADQSSFNEFTLYVGRTSGSTYDAVMTSYTPNSRLHFSVSSRRFIAAAALAQFTARRNL